jgi:hypothetical protein
LPVKGSPGKGHAQMQHTLMAVYCGVFEGALTLVLDPLGNVGISSVVIATR